MQVLSEDILRDRVNAIENHDLQTKAVFALDNIRDRAKVKVVTDALKNLRRSNSRQHLALARDLGLFAYTFHPLNAYLAGEIAIALTFLGDPREVITLLEDLFTRIESENASLEESEKAYLTVTLAHAYTRTNRLSQGINVLEALESNAPNVVEALAELYYHNDEPEKTIQLVNATSKRSPKMVQWLARCYMKKGQTDQALKALEMFPNNPKLREVYLEIKAVKDMKSVRPTMFMPRPSDDNQVFIFISHSSKDEKLAARLVKLLCAALDLKRSEIRCTSASGTRLPVGVDTANHLAIDILNSQVFIGLITEESVQSAYVLFELGASWVLDFAKEGHRTVPLLGSGVPYDILPGPFKTRHAIRTNDRADVQQMLSEIGKALKVKLPAPHYYEDELGEFVKF